MPSLRDSGLADLEKLARQRVPEGRHALI